MQFEQLFKQSEDTDFEILKESLNPGQVSQFSAEKITEINDVHRMIKNKVMHFKT